MNYDMINIIFMFISSIKIRITAKACKDSFELKFNVSLNC